MNKINTMKVLCQRLALVGLVTAIVTCCLAFATFYLYRNLSSIEPQRHHDRSAINQMISGLIVFYFIGIGSSIFLILEIKRLGQRAKDLEQGCKTLKTILLPEGSAEHEDAGVDQFKSMEQAASSLTVQLAEARKKTKALIEKAVDVICVIDVNSKFVSVSPACTSAWGYAPAELEGQSIFNIIQSSQNDLILQQVLGAVKSIARVVFECRLKRKDGELIDIVWTGYWSASDAGLFSIIHDVSERKKVEKLKSEFMAMIVHDIRAPLNSVTGLLDAIEWDTNAKTERAVRIKDNANQSIDQVLRLIDDLIDLEKIDSGKFSLSLTDVHLEDVIKQAVEILHATAEEKHLKIAVEFPSDTVCWGDHERLLQVLVNLISNAIKFSPENGRVKIQVQNEMPNLRVIVSDEGQGIPLDKVSKVFEKFEHANSSDASLKGGKGLGLAICKAIVAEHGGTIGVQAKEPRGTSFWLTLPSSPHN